MLTHGTAERINANLWFWAQSGKQSSVGRKRQQNHMEILKVLHYQMVLKLLEQVTTLDCEQCHGMFQKRI